MEKWTPSSLPVELRVQALLLENRTPDAVADQLLKELNFEQLSYSEVESLCQFFLNFGFHASLKDLIAKNLSTLKKIPWAYFVESIFLSNPFVETEIKELIVKGAEEDSALEELARTPHLDLFDYKILEAREKRKQSFQNYIGKIRADLLSQLEIHQSQGLHDQEEIVLLKLLRLFPGEPQFLKAFSLLKEKVALEFVAQRPQKSKLKTRPRVEKSAEEIALLQIIHESQKENILTDFLADDYAVSHIFWNNPEAGLSFLPTESPTPSQLSLQAEMDILSERFIDLLDLIPKLEVAFASHPDALLGCLVLRAQALHGIGQSYSAIEILESLIAVQPDFRAAAILLSEIKEELE